MAAAACTLPTFSPPSTRLLQSKDKLLPPPPPAAPPTIFLHDHDHHHHHHHHHTVHVSPLSLTKHLEPPPVEVSQLNDQVVVSRGQDNHQKNDFYVNLGLAVRTLREDLPLIFTRDLNYHIYRDDITSVDPLNKFTGIENYKLIFWALRFQGRILFRDISLEVFRVWQPSENVILIRWNLRGVLCVPWEAKGHLQFQGTSRYKLDRNGKIYQHKVDNLAFNFPHQLKPAAASVLDLAASNLPG